MVAAISPGVFILEQDQSLYAPALSPTSLGFIGTATKGTPDEATLVTNESQLTDTFGIPRTKDFGMLAAVEALKAGRILWFIRIAGPARTTGQLDVLDDGSVATAASIGPSSNGETYDLVAASTESPAGTRTIDIDINYDNGSGPTNLVTTFTATQADADNSPGSATYDLDSIDSGNPVFLTVRVDGNPVQTITFASTDPLISSFTAVTPAEVTNVINDQLLGGMVSFATNVVSIASDVFGSGSSVQITGGNANSVLAFTTVLQSGSGDVADLMAVTGAEIKTVIEAASGGDLVVNVGLSGEITIQTATTGLAKTIEIVSATSPMVGAAPLVNLTPLDSTVLGTDTSAAQNTIRFAAKSPGSHSSDITVRISDSSALAGTKKIEFLVRGIATETFDKLSKGGLVSGSLDLIDAINNGDTDSGVVASELVTASDLNAAATDPANISTPVALSAGLNGDDWTPGTVIGTTVGGLSTGLQIFRDPDNIFINILVTPGISYSSVIVEGIDICETRGDCLYVVDAPQNLTAAEVVDWHNGDSSIVATVDQENRTDTNSVTFNSSYAALYAPFVKIFEKFNDQEVFIPPSAIITRTIAHTDQVADPWFAPAGPNRTQKSSVLELESKFTGGEQDLMQQPGNNVNPIRDIVGNGVTIMGQKTLQRASTALDRVNVRRMLLAVERIIAQAVFFLLFEQNDAIMWRRFINLVQPTLDDVRNRRGLIDFRVIADSSTTTATLIDQNTFVGLIFLKPTKSAEKLIVPFNLVPTGANFEEFVQA